jgi:hypothetical protein
MLEYQKKAREAAEQKKQEMLEYQKKVRDEFEANNPQKK